MKKILVYSIAATMMLITATSADAFQPKSSDYEVVQDSAAYSDSSTSVDAPESESAEELKPTNITPLNEEQTEYKFKYGKKLGYFNKDSNIKFITDFDNIQLLDEYLKIKKDGKYGIVDKEGTVIIPPVCQKIEVINSNENKYFIAKIEGKYNILYTTGNLVPETELTSVPKGSMYLLADAIRPEFVQSYIDSQTVYEKVEPDKAPEDKVVYEIQEMEVPGKVKAATVEKNIQQQEVAVKEKAPVSENKFKIKDKEFTLIYDGDKFGVKNDKDIEILPAQYDSISLKNPSENFKAPVLLTEKEGYVSMFDLNGKLLAEQTDSRINVYERKTTYYMNYTDSEGLLYKNDKVYGKINKEGSNYKYTPIGFQFLAPHKINEIFVTMLSFIK